MTRLTKLVRVLEILIIRLPVMVVLATSVFAYEYYVVPNSEQVELTASSPDVAGWLIMFSGAMFVFGLADRLGLEKAYKRVWSYIHRVAQYARRRVPNLVTLSALKLLDEIEDKAPFACALVLSLPLLIPGILGWKFLLPRLRDYIWDPLFKRLVPLFWLTINSRIYTSLDPSEPSIRLLHIHPGYYDDPIVCQLEEADVDEADFEAVSYAWGGHLVLRRRIWMNGFPFFVTENIIRALRHLRRTDKIRVLWIDQMCINQLDEKEKTNQVTHKMHLVYRNATQVIAWLGVGAPDITWAFQHALRYPGKRLEDIEDADPPPMKPLEDDMADSWFMTIMTYPLVWSLWMIQSDKNEEPEVEREDATLRHYRDVWSGVFQRRWFGRIWVIQETALARHLVVKCGDAEMSWDALKSTASDLRTIHRSGPGGYARTLMDFAGHANQHGNAELLDLAIRFRRYNSTDPRDKLIGLLALARDGRQFSEVGYNFHDKAVFANFTVAYIQRSQSLAILGLAETRSTDGNVPEGSMCSWALDWSSHDAGIYNPEVLWGTRLEESHIAELASYSASGHRPVVCRREPGPPIPPLTRGIFLRGWHEDTVEAVSVRGSKWDRVMLNILPIWREFVIRHLPNVSSVQDKFSKIITAELIPSFKDQPWGAWYVPQATSGTPKNEGVSEGIRQASLMLESLCHGRRLFVTSKGRLGIGPSGTSIGDEICILEGSAVPFVLRRWQDLTRLFTGGFFSRKPFDYNRPYCYVGQAVISGLMYNTSDDISTRAANGDIILKEIWLR